MTSKFSGAIQLTDLNDFITPSQACVRPVKIEKTDENSISSIEVNNETGQYYQVNIDGTRRELKKTKIDLSDCLACSGCVTSAESVLVNQQSVDEFLRILSSCFNYKVVKQNATMMDESATSTSTTTIDDHDSANVTNTNSSSNNDDEEEEGDLPFKILVVSISPQSIASIAAYFNCTIIEAERRLHYMFHTLGATRVFDTTWSRHFSHLEMCHEFDKKFSAIATQRLTKTDDDTATTTTTTNNNNNNDDQTNPLSSSIMGRRPKRVRTNPSTTSTTASSGIPMLASACPGFVCYAEKTFGDFIVPYISTTKSPQQIMGSIVKQFFVRVLNEDSSQMSKHLTSANIYHVSVMPCFDKKLEASREDFQIENGVKEVDIVLTSSELVNLLKTQFQVVTSAQFKEMSPGIDTSTTHQSHLGFDAPLFKFQLSDMLSSGISESMDSGGYTETLFRFAAKRYFGVDLPTDQPLQYKVGRNSDFKEVVLQVDKKNVMRFAIANGFRNIQNVIRKLKSGRCEYDFIEVMACPSGCVNGGGQISAPESVQPREHLQRVRELYKETLVGVHPSSADDSTIPSIQEAYDSWIKGGVYSEQAKSVFHTQYHARQHLQINPLTIQW